MSIAQSRNIKKFRPSSVDESLFGAKRVSLKKESPYEEFDPPWVKETEGDSKLARPLLFYCPSSTPSSERLRYVSAPASTPHRSSPKKKNRRAKFTSSFVDELLFKSPRRNSKEIVPSFDPPWADQREKSTRPILWDYSGTRTFSYPTDSSSLCTSGCDGTINKHQSTERTRTKAKQKITDNRKPWR